MTHFLTTCCLAVAIFIVGCQAPQISDNSAEALAGIEATNAVWMAAFEQGDAAGIAALYTEDAQLLPPNGATMSGRPAVQEAFQGMIDAGLNVKLASVEVEGHGDTAFEIGSATEGDLRIRPLTTANTS